LSGIEGQPPTVFDKPTGCPFTPRCLHAMAKCATEVPPVHQVTVGHSCACWLYP
jgi:oligopeptide/dipeptide ABC transporter ATP-binding protein